MPTLLDLINEADLLEIDGHSIRYFGLNEDEMADAEAGEEEAIVLSVEMVDENYDKYEWYFSYKELVEARRKDNGTWVVNYGDGDGERDFSQKMLVNVYRLELL